MKRHDGSVMTIYDDDERAFWKDLRRGLVKDGLTSSKIGQYKKLILTYVRELVDKGVFDDDTENNLDMLSQEDNDTEGNLGIPFHENDQTYGNVNMSAQENDHNHHIEGNIHLSPQADTRSESNLNILSQDDDHTKDNMGMSSQDLSPTPSSHERFENTNGFAGRQDAPPATSPDLHHEEIGDGYSSKDGTPQKKILTGNDHFPEPTFTNYSQAYIEQDDDLIPINEAKEDILFRSKVYDMPYICLTSPYLPIYFYLSLEELYFGGDRKVFVRHQSGRCIVYRPLILKIKPGLRRGSRIEFKEAGNQLKDGRRQDVHFIVLEVQ